MGTLPEFGDVRGHGGLIVGPGSWFENKRYTVGNLRLPTPLPEKIEAMLREGKRRERSDPDDPVPGVTVDDPCNIQYFADWCAGNSRNTVATPRGDVAKPCIEGQGGNNTLAATGAMAHDYGLSKDQGYVTALEHHNPRCEPPWDDDDYEIHFCSGYQSASGTLGNRAPKRSYRHLFKPYVVADGGEIVADLPEPQSELLVTMQAALGNDIGSFAAIPLYNLDDLASLPAPEWDMDRLIGRGKLGMIVGKWAQFKTFTALDMAVALAAQIPWPEIADTGCKQYAVPKPRRILYVAAEGGAAEFHQRLEAALQNRKIIDRDQVRRNFVLAAASAPLDTTSGQIAIVDVIERATKELGGPPEVIFFDTLAKSMAGEENSNTDMGKVQGVAAAIQQNLDCTFIFVHHTGKDGEKSGRGASSMPAGLDFLFHVIGDQATKVATVNVEKQKDAPAEKNIILQGRVIGNSLAFVRVEKKPGNPDEQLMHLHRRDLAKIIEDRGGEPLTTTQLVDELAPNAILDLDTSEPETRRKAIEALRSKLRRSLFDPKLAKTEEAVDFRDLYREGTGQKTVWKHKDAVGS
jgi:hypothetical protein